MYTHILYCICTNTLGCFLRLLYHPVVSCSVTWSCRSTMMGLCWGRCAAGWSMRGAVLVWLYCLDSSKATCWWCWEKSRWWKVSSWTRELSSTGLSRLPHWCLSGGLQQNTQKGIVAADESIHETYKQTPSKNIWFRQEGVQRKECAVIWTWSDGSVSLFSDILVSNCACWGLRFPTQKNRLGLSQRTSMNGCYGLYATLNDQTVDWNKVNWQIWSLHLFAHCVSNICWFQLHKCQHVMLNKRHF